MDEIVLFYLIFGVLVTGLKLLEISLDRKAERVRQSYGGPEPVPVRVRVRMNSGDQAD